jgi:drug/metabolite transporter (DMT)-like permease
LFTALLAVAVLKERIHLLDWILMVIGGMGALIVFAFSSGSPGFINWFGFLNAIALAIQITAYRYVGMRAIHQTIGMFVYVILIASAVWVIGGFSFPATQTIGSIIALGVVTTGLGHALFLFAARRIRAISVSITDLLLGPIIGVAVAVLLINEQVDWYSLAGGGMIVFAGIVLKLEQTLRHLPSTKRSEPANQ